MQFKTMSRHRHSKKRLYIFILIEKNTLTANSPVKDALYEIMIDLLNEYHKKPNIIHAYRYASVNRANDFKVTWKKQNNSSKANKRNPSGM